MFHMAKAVIKKGLNTTKSLILQTQKAEANIRMWTKIAFIAAE